MSTRIDFLRRHINSMEIAVAIGHGYHANSEPFVKIPHNVYVAFMTKPAYLGHLQNTAGESFSRVFFDEDKVRQFVRGNLPMSEMPTLVTQKDWDWTHHVYSPGMMVHNHILEMFDNGMDPIRFRYHQIAGLHILGTPVKSWGRGEDKTLQQLMVKVSEVAGRKKAILFISGCRGDKSLSEQLLKQALRVNQRTGQYYLVGKQNYNVTLTNLTQTIVNKERNVARFTRLKRIRNTNGPPSKRAAVSNTQNMNINNNTNRFKNFLNRVSNAKRRGVPINSLRKVYPSNFNTYNRARRAIGNLANGVKVNQLKSKGYSNVEIQLALKHH